MTNTRTVQSVGPYARGAGRFALIVGIAMILLWAWLLITDDVPDLDTRPLAMWFHIVGEVATGIVLIASGWGLLTGTVWARRLYLVAIGMLLLAVTHAIAWYGGRGEFWMVVAMVMLAVLGVFFAIRAEE
ncbi:MAG: hypothetical protein KDJ86_03690 [Bauldia sp.]|uniref:hypothetical protein n=1 Tax=Bauldia sp. TaxID=2575872 RepID=UPI001D1EE8EF|nr:hypothetical protein [Bauldia sp.]MCB1494865.1 hypothetical protein [Bauldia sp.]